MTGVRYRAGNMKNEILFLGKSVKESNFINVIMNHLLLLFSHTSL